MDILKNLAIKAHNPGAYIGNWQSEVRQNSFAVYSPSTEQLLAEVSNCSSEDYDSLMQRAKVAALEWKKYPAPKRGDIIRQIGEILRENKDALGSLVSLEMGKSKQEGDGEVQEMIDMADFSLGQSRMLYGKTMHSERFQHRMYEQWHPYGLVAVISAFNFPVAVWAWNAFIAAICGNVTLWKPSTKTPLTAIAVMKLCAKVLQKNHCPEIFGLIISADHGLAEDFVMDKRIPLLSFTGSTRTGRQIAVRVASRLGKTLLELGGNNAVIVDKSANLALAIPAIVFGALGTAGQRCTSTRRVFIEASIFEQVTEALVHAYQQIKIGDPLQSQNHMGPLIDKKAVANYFKAIDRIKALGGSIIYGGKALEGPGFYVEPTLVTQGENHWDIIQEETFAPILYLMPFKDINEAIRLQNAVSQGLSSALFTQDLKNAEIWLSDAGSDCGIANINIGTSGAEIGGAFGGEKETGGGREAGSDAWQTYMWRQTNTINWGDSLPLAQGIEFRL